MRAASLASILTLTLLGCSADAQQPVCRNHVCVDITRTVIRTPDAATCPPEQCPIGEEWVRTACTCGIPSCRGVGLYEAGKEGSYRPCCAGLNTAQELKPAYAAESGKPVCTQAIGVNRYACVEGSCGDGRCEAPENEACGCTLDCPNAVWGPDAGF